MVEAAALAVADAGDATLAAPLSALSEALAQLQSDPTDGRLWTRVTLRLDNIDALLHADPVLGPFVPPLQDIRTAAANRDIATLLPLLAVPFAGIASVIVQRAGHTFTLALSPGNVTLQPGEQATFAVRVENHGTAPTTVALSVGTLPAGVTAHLNLSEVTLAAGEVRDASSANPVLLTLDQSLVSTAVFPLQVTGTAVQAPTLTQTASAYVAVRPALADVLRVVVDPVVVDAGKPVAVSAQVLNSANAVRTVLARLTVLDTAGAVLATPPDVPVNLVPGTGTLDINLGVVDTTGLANGLYSLYVALRATDGTPLPGRAAQTPFFVGAPVTATVKTAPSLVPPGTPTVTTTIEVTNQTAMAQPGPGSKSCTDDPTYPLGKWNVNCVLNFDTDKCAASILFTSTTGGTWLSGNGPGTFTTSGPLLSGSNVTLTLTAPGGYIATDIGVVSVDGCSITGTGSDNQGHVGTVRFDWAEQGKLHATLKWSWSSSPVLPDYVQVMMTPAVIDLNGDGVPDIVFVTFRGENYFTAGHLRAISGKDGSELFTVTDTRYNLRGAGSVAVGDIDLDGRPDIISVDDTGNALIAFAHDGTFKWRSPPLPGSGRRGNASNGGACTADINGDGIPEIIIGATVLNNDGTIRWAGGLGHGANVVDGGDVSPFSLVADLDLDGDPEIVAGNTAYRSNGSVYWHNSSLPDGFNAIGNFDDDPFPEIVLVARSNVYLLAHNGTVKWGPVPLPGGPVNNDGGPPTVADVDGDGKPDIGVAGGSFYTVFDGNGHVKWSSPTQDLSSNRTGSSVFDFDGDGKVEVVYGDELKLRVFRGSDGTVLWETPSPSGTAYEYLVIVDVDGDGHADIVKASNNYYLPGSTGIQVYSDVANTWVPTRKIWNQHTYHITNVNEDGTIPRVEQNNWQVPGLNNYRLNTFGPGDRGTVDAMVEVRHQLPNTGYIVNPTSVNPQADAVSASEVVWSVRLPFNDPTPRQFQLTGQVPNLAPGESREISLGTEVTTRIMGTNTQPLHRFADVVLDYFDSGAGPMPGPYGGTTVGSRGPGQNTPIPVSLDVVLGDDPGPTGFPDFLSLPRESFVTVGFTDKTVIDGLGNDLFIHEYGGGGERADIFVSANLVDFVFLGKANNSTTTAFDLASIGFTEPVRAVKIVGLDNGGSHPGFDLLKVEVLPASVGPPQIETHLALPPVIVAATHIVSLAPPAQTVPRGAAGAYSVQLTNPFDTAETFTLSTLGLEEFNMNLATSVTVPAGATVSTPLTVTVPAGAAEGERVFSVLAQTATGGLDTVEGRLIIAGGPSGGPPPPVALESRAVHVALMPSQSTAGQGTPATYRVIVTNVGDAADTYALSGSFPTGFTGVFATQTVAVLPGLGNFREVLLTLTPPPGTVPGNYSFTVSAVSTTQTSVHAQATGAVSVLGNGVKVALNPASGFPGSPFMLTVTNTGQVTDTFDLTLGGPAGLFATLGSPVVTLAPGASQTVPITLGAITAALPGDLALVAVATSRANAAVQSSATATVHINATQGVMATFNPQAVTLGAPGKAAFVLQVQNTGNTEDAYTATITGTSGPVTSGLHGLAGQLTQTIPIFRLPGLATGALLLDATLMASGMGSVTVQVTSQSNGTISAADTATVQTSNQAPVADAGPDQFVLFGSTVSLNGSNSTAPDHGPVPLRFAWRLTGKPAPSTLTDANITDATTALASFKPDVRGDFTLALTVSDDALPATDTVTVHVLNNPPVANAGRNQNAETHKPVTLNGSQSFDPDGDVITYDWSLEWSLQAKPAASTLTDVDMTGRTTPTPSFTPDVDGDYVVRLVVRDGQEDSAPAVVTVTATTPNIAPNAHAGKAQNAFLGQEVFLDGTASDDPDHGPQALTFLWSFKTRPAASHLMDADIVPATAVQASFVPDGLGTYVLTLMVFDGQDSSIDDVTITVSRDVIPNADAGSEQTLTLGKEVGLDGRASNDPDHGPAALTFAWRFVSLPQGSRLTNTDMHDATTPTPRFTPDVRGHYVVELRVFDGLESAFDNVIITVLSFRDVSQLVTVVTANERSTLDRRTGQTTSTADVTITNISTTTIAAPVQAVFVLSAANVNMPEASGVDGSGHFFYDLAKKAGIQALAPGQAVTFHAKFVRPSTVRFTYNVGVFGMVP